MADMNIMNGYERAASVDHAVRHGLSIISINLVEINQMVRNIYLTEWIIYIAH